MKQENHPKPIPKKMKPIMKLATLEAKKKIRTLAEKYQIGVLIMDGKCWQLEKTEDFSDMGSGEGKLTSNWAEVKRP